MNSPWYPIRDSNLTKVLNQPQPIRREYRDRVKDVEEPKEPTEFRMSRTGLLRTYQTTATYRRVSRSTKRRDKNSGLTISLLEGLSS